MKNYFKKLAVFLSFVLIFSVLMPAVSCMYGAGEFIEAATMKLSQTEVTMNRGDTLQLKVKNLPKNAKVTWSSNKKSDVSVSSKGLVTAVVPNSSAKITATVNYKQKVKKKYKNKTKKLTCLISTVYPPLERTLNVDEQHVGQREKFELSVIDADIYDKIIYSSKDAYIATVDINSGIVTGVGLGETIIYADVTSADKTQTCRLECKVEVIPQSQSRYLSDNAKYVEQFRDFRLEVRGTSTSSSVDYIEYSSTDNNIVTVNNTGTTYANVTGVNIGTAYIIVKIKKTGNEVETKTCRVVVKEYNKSRSIYATSSTITKGDKTQKLVISGLDPVLDSVKYESSDSKVAKVSDSGMIEASGAGSTKITATVTFPTGEVSILTYEINVIEPASTTTKS